MIHLAQLLVKNFKRNFAETRKFMKWNLREIFHRHYIMHIIYYRLHFGVQA